VNRRLDARKSGWLSRFTFSAAILSLASCAETPSEPLLPPSFQEVQPPDVPVPPTFLLVGSPYTHQVGSFRAASAEYRGKLVPADADVQVRELLAVHGWGFVSSEPIPGRTDGRQLAFRRNDEHLQVQIYKNAESTSLEVEIRTLMEEKGI
jgi:hypothetical protein